MTITVYLLDDHEIVRRGLRELPESTDDLLVVGESGLAQEAARRSHRSVGFGAASLWVRQDESCRRRSVRRRGPRDPAPSAGGSHIRMSGHAGLGTHRNGTRFLRRRNRESATLGRHKLSPSHGPREADASSPSPPVPRLRLLRTRAEAAAAAAVSATRTLENG